MRERKIKEKVTDEEITLAMDHDIYKPYYALKIAGGYFVRAYNTTNNAETEIVVIFDENGKEIVWQHKNREKWLLFKYLFPTLAYAKEKAREFDQICEDMKDIFTEEDKNA